MIIFGTRARTQVLDEGEFTCPRCGVRRRYQRKQARPYFALYFIPIFPVGQGMEFVECQTCGAAFEPEVLTRKLPEPKLDLAAALNTIGERLADGAPIDFVIRDLTAAGLDFEVARAVVEAQATPKRQHCPACGLTYVAGIRACASCGGPLQDGTAHHR